MGAWFLGFFAVTSLSEASVAMITPLKMYRQQDFIFSVWHWTTKKIEAELIYTTFNWFSYQCG